MQHVRGIEEEGQDERGRRLLGVGARTEIIGTQRERRARVLFRV